MKIKQNMFTLRILVVDDDPDDRDIFREVLSEISSSIQYEEATNGKDALQVLEKLKEKGLPDYIFLDLNMPMLNGKQCLREIRKDIDLLHIPIIIYTTSTREEDIKETKKLGAAFFLTKPEKFNELKNAISFIIDGHKLQAKAQSLDRSKK
jgi:CheY-like chemotaxis protein